MTINCSEGPFPVYFTRPDSTSAYLDLLNVNSLILDPFTFKSTEIFLLILHAKYLKCYQDIAKVVIF